LLSLYCGLLTRAAYGTFVIVNIKLWDSMWR
jgi:hypothetical protein